MEDLSAEALVLRTRPYGESDLIVVLLTDEYGKISAIAKGARRSKRRFPPGLLELFQHLRIRFARRPHASLAFLHDCTLINSHHVLASDLESFAWATYLCELVDVMTPERDPCRDLFDLLKSTFEALPDASSPQPLAHHFMIGLLDHGGWRPDFEVCGVCGTRVNGERRPILDHRGSGVICSRHEAEKMGLDPDAPGFKPSRRIIDADLLDYIARAGDGVPDETDAGVVDAASALLDRLVGLHLPRPLKSRGFLATVTSGQDFA